MTKKHPASFCGHYLGREEGRLWSPTRCGGCVRLPYQSEGARGIAESYPLSCVRLEKGHGYSGGLLQQLDKEEFVQHLSQVSCELALRRWLSTISVAHAGFILQLSEVRHSQKDVHKPFKTFTGNT